MKRNPCVGVSLITTNQPVDVCLNCFHGWEVVTLFVILF